MIPHQHSYSSSSSLPSWFTPEISLVVGTMIGLAIGFRLGSSERRSWSGRRRRWGTATRTRTRSTLRSSSKNVDDNDDDDDDDDSSLRVLEGALNMFHERWIRDGDDDERTRKSRKVVRYLTPETMLRTLFHDDDDDDDDATSKPSMSLRRPLRCTSSSSSSAAVRSMLELFSSVTRYSVDTSHPYFFNQLFGATDPIALAAELVALSVNTSVYTYETAPVFTMIEREVVSFVVRAVYGPGVEGDGLMMPGGALSNLSALHAARQRYLARREERSKRRRRRDDDGGYDFCRDDPPSPPPSSSSSSSPPRLVAFVSEEAHYSFAKAASVTGLGKENLVAVRASPNGVMDADDLDRRLREAVARGREPFFVGATAGSTVRGSFDSVAEVAEVRRRNRLEDDLWIHVDGAWGGAALFSRRRRTRDLLRGVEEADSLTLNPHKMLGAPQQTTVFVSRRENVLKHANSSHAKYLFDERKHGADHDLGDASYTCGRRTDAVKIWAMLKYHGAAGLGRRVDRKVDDLAGLVRRIRRHPSFLLACAPWPFNVNFFFLPRRVRRRLAADEGWNRANGDHDDDPTLPDDVSDELRRVTVELKLRLHESGEMLLPYQPLSNQRADCFRVVLAGDKRLTSDDVDHVLTLMIRYGEDL